MHYYKNGTIIGSRALFLLLFLVSLSCRGMENLNLFDLPQRLVPLSKPRLIADKNKGEPLARNYEPYPHISHENAQLWGPIERYYTPESLAAGFFRCEECNISGVFNHLPDHIITHHNYFSCCSRFYLMKAGFPNHVKHMHANNENLIEQYQKFQKDTKKKLECVIKEIQRSRAHNNKLDKQEGARQEYLHTFINNFLATNYPEQVQKKGTFACSMCDNNDNAIKISDLISHAIDKHLPILCPHCTLEFSFKGLTTHLNARHGRTGESAKHKLMMSNYKKQAKELFESSISTIVSEKFVAQVLNIDWNLVSG